MTEQDDKTVEVNPFEPAIRMSETWMEGWSEVLSKTVASRTFAKALGMQMDLMMESSKLLRQQSKSASEFMLRQVGMPSAEQVTGLAQRLTHLEIRLDDIEAKVDESLDLLRALSEEAGGEEQQDGA